MWVSLAVLAGNEGSPFQAEVEVHGEFTHGHPSVNGLQGEHGGFVFQQEFPLVFPLPEVIGQIHGGG